MLSQPLRELLRETTIALWEAGRTAHTGQPAQAQAEENASKWEQLAAQLQESKWSVNYDDLGDCIKALHDAISWLRQSPTRPDQLKALYWQQLATRLSEWLVTSNNLAL